MSATGDIRDEVRDHYARAALDAASGAECGCGEGACCGEPAETAFGGALYADAQRGELPEAAVLASLGCGNPTAVAERLGDRGQPVGLRPLHVGVGERLAARLAGGALLLRVQLQIDRHRSTSID